MTATEVEYLKPVPRPYQIEAKDNFLAGTGNMLVQLPTGTGKTVVSASICDEYPGERILFLAHTGTLVWQTCRTMMKLGMWPNVEKADEYKGGPYLPDGRERKKMFPGGFPPHEWFRFDRVWVSTIQTFVDRVDKYREGGFDMIVIDEAHRSLSRSFVKTVERLVSFNPKVRVLGLTATPYRGDKQNLGKMFPQFAYRMPISDGIEQGWLVDVVCERATLAGVDESMWKVGSGKTGGRDLTDESVAASMNNKVCIESISHEVLERAGDRRGILFLPGVAVTESVCATMNEMRPGCAVFVHGGVPKRENKKRIRMIEDGDSQFILGCDQLCLDEQTEILTAGGWRGIDTLTGDDLVANWHALDGHITFEKPSEVIVRDRSPGEGMVSLETSRHSVRVTDRHRMVRLDHKMRPRINRAHQLVGKATRIPVSGVAEPLPVLPTQESAGGDQAARIRANAYVLRKKGMSPEDAKAEAIRRANQRDSLRYKNPTDLTPEECEFIGFWLADGNRVALTNGGVEYRVLEGAKLATICERIEHLLASVGTEFIRRETVNKDTGTVSFQWSMPRGTGFGSQTRRGLYPLEPYLDKGANPLLWGLTGEQFMRVLHGLWMGNGTSHLDRIKPDGDSFAFVLRHKELIDTIQAVAVCRGLYCNVRPVRKVKDHHSQQYIVHISTVRKYHSTHGHKVFTKEAVWKPERVWCVNVPSSFIVTRRRGAVTVTGNCEGFDVPEISLVVMARFTAQRGKYEQMLGRGLRVLAHAIEGKHTSAERVAAIKASAKPDMMVLDFANNSRFKLISAADVLLKSGDEKQAKKLSEYVRKHRDENDRRALRDQLDVLESIYALEEAARKGGGIPAKADFNYHHVDLFSDGRVTRREQFTGKTDARRPTGEMVRQADDLMIPPERAERMSQGELRQAIERQKELKCGRKNFGFLVGGCKIPKEVVNELRLNWHDATYLRNLMRAQRRDALPDNWRELVANNRRERATGRK